MPPDQDLAAMIDRFRALAAADRDAILTHLPVIERNRLTDILSGGPIDAAGPQRFSADLADRIDRLANDTAVTEAGRAALGQALVRSRPHVPPAPLRSQSLAAIIGGWLGMGVGQ